MESLRCGEDTIDLYLTRERHCREVHNLNYFVRSKVPEGYVIASYMLH